MWRSTGEILDRHETAVCERCRRNVLVGSEHGRRVLYDTRIGVDGERWIRAHRCDPNPDAMPLLEGYLP